MYGYLFRRLLGTIPVMLVVAVFIFLMLRLTPADPAAIIAGDNATSEQVAQIRTQLGLDRPIIEQFVIWSGSNVAPGAAAGSLDVYQVDMRFNGHLRAPLRRLAAD